MTVPSPELLTYEGLAKDRARLVRELADARAENERLREEMADNASELANLRPLLRDLLWPRSTAPAGDAGTPDTHADAVEG